jgi:hypothetical protein
MKILLAFSLLAGCVLPTSQPGDDGDDPDVPEVPEVPDVPPKPPVVVASGLYQVQSTIDLTVEAVLPEPAAAMVVTLRDFSTQPAHTLITLAEQAGVPAVSQLRSVLPDALESRFEGWLDDEIAKVEIDGVPVTEVAASAAALAELALTRFELESELQLDGDRSSHRLTAIDLAPAGLEGRVALDVEISAPLTATSGAGAVALGDHGFGLAYGEYLWRACDAAFAARYGNGIRATLGQAVNCPRIAQAIAGKCVLGVCVGHADLIEELCERGLDEVVERAHDKFAALRFDVLHFASGTARLVDTTQDGIADALTEGVWTAEINAGQGLRHVPATFEAAAQ